MTLDSALGEGKEVSGNFLLGSEESNRKPVFSSPLMRIRSHVAPNAAGSLFVNMRKTQLRMKPKLKAAE